MQDKLLKELEPFNLRWVEEMLLPDEIHNFAKLKKETSIPLSGGDMNIPGMVS